MPEAEILALRSQEIPYHFSCVGKQPNILSVETCVGKQLAHSYCRPTANFEVHMFWKCLHLVISLQNNNLNRRYVSVCSQ